MLLKICGLKKPQDVEFCDFLGVDLVGFVFFKKSPRYISPGEVKSISTKNAKKVGVFVDEKVDNILSIMDYAKLDFVQIHGPYNESQLKGLKKEKVILTRWPDTYRDQNDFLNDIENSANRCNYFLFDSGIKGGGHGKSIEKISYLKAIPENIKWLIAGGITEHNIDTILKEVTPFGIDISSGVEIKKGVKDRKKILNIFNKIKELK